MKIFKLQIDLTQGVKHYMNLPLGATILTVQVQYGVPCIWFLCEPEAPVARRCIAFYGTCHDIPPNPGKYIGTVQFNDGGLVLHVFDAS